MLALTFFYFSLLFSAVLASPASLPPVIFDPSVTNPHEGTVWVVGAKETVTWDTSILPPDEQLTLGKVILGHLSATGGLIFDNVPPLALNFELRDGKVTVTVPDVPVRKDYFVVLEVMDISGRLSSSFTIKGGSLTSTSTTTIHTTGTKTTGGGSASSTDSNSSTTKSRTTDSSSSATKPTTTQSNSSATKPTATNSSSSVLQITTATMLTLPLLPTPPATFTQLETAAEATGTTTPTAASAAWNDHNLKLWSIIVSPLLLLHLL